MVERPPVEEELPRDDAEAPPVDAPCVAFAREDLGSHVCHRARDARVQPALRVVDRDVEICQVRMTLCIQEDVVRLEVPGGEERRVRIHGDERGLRGWTGCDSANGVTLTGVLCVVYVGIPARTTARLSRTALPPLTNVPFVQGGLNERSK